MNEPQETQPEPQAAEAKEEAAKPSKRAIVAEDEVLIRMDIVETLQEGGYEVVGEAGNGEEGVNLTREHRPDVVVMDIKMPVMDGLTAAEHIANEKIAPVVILTAFSQTDLVERASEAGAMAYVVKPFTPADLIPAVEIARSRYLEIKALEAEISDISERMEIRKKVERAKGLLMEKMKLNEPEAFRWIQKTSMDRRLTMREVAEAVIEQMASGNEPKEAPKKGTKDKGSGDKGKKDKD